MDLKRPMADFAATSYPTNPREATMARCNYPKYASYMGDGSGRDTYVVLNNGGLTNCDKNYMMSRPFRRTQQNFNPSPQKEATAHKYQSDGSGRDSYVISNSGGLVSDFHGSNRADVNFVSGLRQCPANVMPARNLLSPYTH
jgi:hypothetical protein